MDHPYRLPFLFDKYLQKQCTSEEVAELANLLQTAEAESLLTEPMLAVWQHIKDAGTEYPVDWNTMYNVISSTQAKPGAYVHSRKFYATPFFLKSVAALLILFAGIGIYWYVDKYAGPGSKVPSFAVAKDDNKTDRQQTIHLSDGSTVILHGDSRLDYPSVFTGNTREVYLKGEGYFDIRPDARAPFMVRTGRFITKVLGTSFNIKVFNSEEELEVTVSTGRVQLLNGKQSIGLISANEQLSFFKNSGVLKRKIEDITSVIAWRPGEMEFNDITMMEAAVNIGQRFNMLVVFDNPAIENCRVTATFSANEDMEEILSVVCGVSQATYTIQEGKIIIYGKGCK